MMAWIGKTASSPEPDFDSLRVLVHAWSQHLSGVLETPRGEMVLVDGEPVGAWGRALAERAPWLQPVCFREETRTELGEEAVLGATLWEAAAWLARPDRLTAGVTMRPWPAFERAMDLPLHARTRLFLADPRGGRFSLRDLMYERPDDRTRIVADLARLVVLGLLQAEQPHRTRLSAPPPVHR